mmetsp:Transcript_35145/g.42978  ORF Transcript_35145/g.42978 Transcript_35145/m.42978 type:complete len:105 (-) Transcript_35145:341-655(-)
MVPTDDGETVLDLKRIKKVYEEGMAKRVCMESIHSVVTTKNEELILLFDQNDMHIYDMTQAELDEKTRSYVVTDVLTHKRMNFRGLQLLEDRYLYVMYNQRNNV